jgi:sterol desaturase/sphingolipid hydroxylase (fatty acid hydroxylase superfamily)
MDWFALPMFEGVHLPFFFLIQYLTGWQSMWGGAAAIMAYYICYEFCHYCMHVPSGHRFEKMRYFVFINEHHRIHHKHMQQNFNVFFPLADKCLGTFRSAASIATTQPAAHLRE